MNKLHTLAALALMGTAAATAQADEYYGSVSYAQYDVGDVNPTAIDFRGGMPINDYLNAEAGLTFGVGDDDGVKIKSGYGIGLMAHTEVADSLKVFGTLEFNSAKISSKSVAGTTTFVPGVGTVTTGSSGGSSSESGIGYGFGVEYALDSGSVVAKYRQVMDEDDADVTAISIGYKMPLDF